MQEERIRLTSTDSVNSVNKDTFVDVELQHHTKVFPFPSVSDTIDQREVFEQERADSTKYRLILTINPYCTNVLFNAVTEIVKNEGTDIPSDLTIATADGTFQSDKNTKINSITNTDMVRNTDYSNDGYLYHCGFDMFNNHILRNQTFKLVNPLVDRVSFTHKNTNGSHVTDVKNNYNTIRDFMRYSDGKEVTLTRRTDVSTIEGVSNTEAQNDARHLYLKDDIMEFIDCVNANLSEQNGWWGFNNRSSIPSCKFTGTNNGEGIWEDLKISKVFNGEYFDGSETQEHMACEFIEMYPDSSLYSFCPKYNVLQNREEQNWDISIMYPYETFGLDYTKDKEKNMLLINGSLKQEDGQEIQYVNALLLASYKQTKGTSGQDIILFRSYVKHNLKTGDKIKLYFNLNNTERRGDFVEIQDRTFEVVNTGNLNDEYLDYYFYINDVNDIKDALRQAGETINQQDKIENNKYTFRFIKVINDRECKYYYRKFRKLPNLKFRKEELTQEIAEDRDKYNTYINQNCRLTNANFVSQTNKEMLPFNKEQYPLAFSRTIYNDGNAQVVFTDTIDIDKITDNLGRPLTELFVCFIKRNKGHDIWYKKTKGNTTAKKKEALQNIEFSHCFGEVISGLEIHSEKTDDEFLKNERKILSDSTLLTNIDGTALNRNITIESNAEDKNGDTLYGDVVELDRNNIKETVLADVQFRFNTEQREHNFNNDDDLNCGKFIIDEIVTDDYDRDGFQCDQIEIKDTTYRPEGYYYKAFYPIQVREFGSMRQGSHKDIKISTCRPRQAEGMFIEVVSMLRSGVNSGDTVYLCDEKEDIMIPLTVNSVQNSVRFLLNPMKPGQDGYISIFDIIKGLLHSDGKTITEEDIENGYTWIDEFGNENIASEEIKDEDNTITESDLGKTIYDYGNPKYILRLKNNDIPNYAYKVGVNVYLWRDVLNVGHKDAVEVPEYPFANGHFYINKLVNFFLKRQDPFNYNGLYATEQSPNDIFGIVKEQSNYEYKDETHRVC